MSAATTTIGPAERKRESRLWALWVLPCLGVAGYAIVRCFFVQFSDDHFAPRLAVLQVHAGAGAVSLLIGPWQFWTWLRKAHARWHRWLGRAYLAAVAVSALAGWILSAYSKEGWGTHLGFGLLAVVWFWTAAMGYRTARARQFRLHREWMVRSFALSLAAVTLRNELPLLLFVARLSFHAAFIIVAWLCWIPNLMFAEWWLRRPSRA